MLRAGADQAATGENAVLVACRRADVIIGPIGIVIADSMLGEITPAMAAAVGQSQARRILLPVNQCDNLVVGTADLSMADKVREEMCIRDSHRCVIRSFKCACKTESKT